MDINDDSILIRFKIGNRGYSEEILFQDKSFFDSFEELIKHVRRVTFGAIIDDLRKKR